MFPIEIHQWAMRHHVGADALVELAAILGSGGTEETGLSEANVQSRVRLAASSFGMRLDRNNVGVLKNEAGTPVRYGLANDTKALNKRLKSADLIGWRRLVIGPEMIGRTIAQYASIETKAAGWKPAPPTSRDFEHEEAQRRWALLVASNGGYARFVTDPAQLAA